MTDPLTRQVGQSVREIRRGQMLTQRQLSDRLRELGWDIDNTAVVRIEGGHRALQLRQLGLLAAALRVEIADLLPTGESTYLAGFRAGIRTARTAMLDALGSTGPDATTETGD